MSTITRGVRNAFRNNIRTMSVVALLGISIALALALYLANEAMKAKISSLKQSAATLLTIMPAGQGFGGEGGGEPLKTEDINKIKNLAHVIETGAFLPSGKTTAKISPDGKVQVPESPVKLESSIDPGTLGRRNFGGPAGAPPPSFRPPIRMVGLEGQRNQAGKKFNMTSGTAKFSGADVAEAIVGKDLAEHNNLKVGSTFTAYDTTFKVVGIYDAANKFENDGVFAPIATVQRLTNQSGEVLQISAKVDSLDNLEATRAAIASALGSSRVDVTSAAQNVTDALSTLKSIQSIALTGMVVALGAAGIITFLVMVMIVRERRREIGVLKAIGASNISVVTQFVTEAMVLTLCGAVVGVLLATLSSNAITGALVNANQTTSSSSTADGGGGSESGGPHIQGGIISQPVETAENLMQNIQTNVGLPILLEGLGAAILIGILGSAVPAWLIAQVRPAEVMRGE